MARGFPIGPQAGGVLLEDSDHGYAEWPGTRLKQYFSLYFGDFDFLLGSFLETILDTFRVPFLHRFSKDFQHPPKVNIHLGLKVIWVVSWVQLQVLQGQSATLLKVVSLSAH